VTRERCLILASRSPRRRSLLSESGWKVTVVPSDADETWPTCDSAGEATCELALRKARRVSQVHQDCPVLAADTVVILEGRVLGKPSSRAHARELLQQLSGCTHEVVTGVALVLGGESWTGWERSQVTFRPLSGSDIERYLEAASYEDKAGAYGIQEEGGGELVQRWEGRFDNIVGLPMNTVESLWIQMGKSRDGLR
jgi:septum formation protein